MQNKIKIGDLLTNEDVINLVGNENQKEAFKKRGKITNSQKNAVFKQFDSLFNYEKTKIGRKQAYKITEIYEQQRAIEDKRVNNGANNRKFTKHLELAILKFCKYMIEENKFREETYEVFDCCEDIKSFTVTKNNLMLFIGVISQNYKQYINNQVGLAKELDIKLENVNNSYLHTTKIEKQVFTAMNNLRKSKNITYANAYLVVEKMKHYDKNGNPIMDKKGNHKFTTNKEAYPETTLEYDAIIKTEKRVLKELNLTTCNIRFDNKAKIEYYDRLRKELNNMDIINCYKVMKISVICTDLLDEDIKKLEEDWNICEKINNCSSYNIMIENSKKRHEIDIENGFGVIKTDAEISLKEEEKVYNKIIKVDMNYNEEIQKKSYNGE